MKEVGPSIDFNIYVLQEIISSWGNKNYQDYPWRHPERKWHGLIAEILLQRTKARNVVPVYEKFINKYPTISDLAETDRHDLEILISPLGLLWRAKFILELGIELNSRKGHIPREYNELIKLPGVGPYVASAWLSFHSRKRYTIIDTNTVRWLCRIYGEKMDGETRRQTWIARKMELLTPSEKFKEFNYSLLDFTMLICKKKPLCSQCPIGEKYCNSYLVEN